MEFDLACQARDDDKIARVGERMPSEETLYDLADFFKVFSDGTRVRILWALDLSEMCVCELAQLLGMTKSAVSHQLRALRQARLVRFRRDGKNVFYALDDAHVRDVLEKALEHLGHAGMEERL